MGYVEQFLGIKVTNFCGFPGIYYAKGGMGNDW
jgi:hypothetical protein